MPRSQRRPCSASPSRCRPGSAATRSRWSGATGELEALDAAGPAPAGADPVEPVEQRGPRSVNVPGAVAGWAALAERHGRLGLDDCLADAIDVAERGFAVGPRTSAAWQPGTSSAAWASAELPDELAPAPRAGQVVRLPELGADAAAHRRGRARRALPRRDRRARSARSAGSRRAISPPTGRAGSSRSASRYRGVEVVELPPPTQGVAALEALGLLEGLEPTLSNRIRVRAARPRGRARSVRDGADVSGLLDPAYLARAPGGRRRRGSEAGGRDGLPLRRRRRPDGGLVHPEPVRELRLRRSSRPAPASCSRTVAAASPSTGASSPASVRTTRSSPGCSCATERCSGRSG